MTTRIPVGVFFALFTASGFAGLIYQSIWSHYLKLFLGHAAYAQTLVLAIFMGGMAVGAWLVSRYTHRVRNLLVGYAIAELGIGLLAIAFHRVFLGATGWAFDTVLPALGGSGVDLFKWTLASSLILPASILLGTTFPLMSAGIMRLYPEVGGRTLSMLYFTNSFGAAFGVLASGFYLIDKVGLPGTLLAAGLMNVVLAATVWLLARRLPVAAPEASAIPGGREAASALGRAILILAFATGAASFIYEITWIRMLTLALGASTHAFEVMLAAFILAMSLGAFWFRNRIGKLGNDLGWLAGILVAKAVFAAWAVWIYGDVLQFVAWMTTSTSRTDGGYVIATFSGFIASLVVMFPSAFCAGMTLPLATHALTSRGHGESSIGRVYGANTAGCIAGAIFATHAGMELAGVKGLTGIGAVLDVATAALVLAAGGMLRARLAAASALVALAGVLVFSAAKLDTLRMASGVFRHGEFYNPKDSTVAFYRDGKTATIAVVDTKTVRAIRTNGKSDASVQMADGQRAQDDEYTMVLAAALPLALNPNVRRVANIGFGSGLTTHTLLASPVLEQLDSIEIERMVIEGARLFAPRNARAFSDPRSRIHIEDAKTFFAAHGQRYDLIVSEPSNPWVSGTATLFSEEFYAQVRRHLQPDGMLVQWVQAYEINLPLLSSIFNALGKHFGDYTVYATTADLLVVATPAARLPQVSPQSFSFPALQQDLARLGVRGPQDLEAMRVGGRAALEPLFRSAEPAANSDYYPILDQRAPRARFKHEHAVELPKLRGELVPLLPLLDRDARHPVARIADLGLNQPAYLNQVHAAAESLGIGLTGAASRARVLSPNGRSMSLIAWRLADGCAGAEAQWLEAVTEVARFSVPRVAQEDVAPFLQRMRASACARSLPEVGKRRLDFLEAANARDAPGMGAAAEWLLERGALAPDERTEYVAAVLVNGILSRDDPRARQAAEKELNRLAVTDLKSLPLKLVLAHLEGAWRARAANPQRP
ncbi:MAG TPA: fused MFS/spermidine synthase [Usitatibacter sp.]|nr:fused MFS/spermidine synthase [Usitatibacter sp.]